MTFLAAFLLAASVAISGEIIMKVDGLACAFCAYGLEKKLKKLNGVVSVDISLNKGIVKMKVKTGTDIEQEVLKKLVKEAGFILKDIKFRETE